jgi:RNA polymerase subunit RPABC4/transcription elongation factor Spt4
MRYCFSCRKITSGNPAYCNYCGKSYDVKLCSRGHSNPRTAEVCSVCGSRNLSIPQTRGGAALRALFSIGLFLTFGALLVGSLAYIGVFVKALIQNPNGLLPLMLLGLALGLVWLFWMLAASALRRLLLGQSGKRKRE